MKKAGKNMNNKGFSLILVIVCMTLIGVLATMIISMSVNNVQMRVVEEEASDNFYSAEEVLDEIRANVEKKASQSLGDAYTLFLQKYAATLPKNRESMFVKTLSDILEAQFVSDFDTNYNETAFRTEYLGVAAGTGDVTIGQATGVSVQNATDGKSSTITIQGLTISYKDQGYETSIKTDLVVKITYPQFFEDSTAVGSEFLDYAIIADGDVKKDSGASGTFITGNVYTGNDLVVALGSNLTVQSSYLIAKNMITVGDGSVLQVDRAVAAAKNSLWTQNIQTTSIDTTKASNNEIIISNTDCYVQDDLTINGIADAVTITYGSYYGYGSGLNMDPKFAAKTNSAINVNAKDVNLKLDRLSRLWLAGQSYISVPTGYGRNVTENIEHYAMQGESVAFKGNQAAYLLPGDCIEGVWHNPMTVKEYEDALQLIQGLVEDPIDPRKNKSLVLSSRKADSINGDIMNLDQYLDMSSSAENGDYTSRYTPVFVQYKTGGTMVYIYMKFSTPNAAKKYFEEYYNLNKDLVNTRMETIGKRGNILIENISEDKITAIGNLVVHDNENGDNPNTVIHSNAAATSAEVREKDYEYSGNFRSLTMTLNANTGYLGSGDKLTECIFRFETISELEALHEETTVTHNGRNYTLYVVNNKSAGTVYTVEEGNNCGLVIATGDVHVNSNFTGLIITQGEVTMGQGITITSAPDGMNALIYEKEELKYFFKYYDDRKSGLESKEAFEIYYENWQKN